MRGYIQYATLVLRLMACWVGSAIGNDNFYVRNNISSTYVAYALTLFILTFVTHMQRFAQVTKRLTLMQVFIFNVKTAFMWFKSFDLIKRKHSLCLSHNSHVFIANDFITYKRLQNANLNCILFSRYTQGSID